MTSDDVKPAVHDVAVTETQTLSLDSIPSFTPDTTTVPPPTRQPRKRPHTKHQRQPVVLNTSAADTIEQKQKQYTQRNYGASVITQDTAAHNDPTPFSNNSLKRIKDSSLRHKLQTDKKRQVDAVTNAAKHDTLLLPTETGAIQLNNDIVKTWQLKQSDLREHVDRRTAAKAYELHGLEYGPYMTRYSRNGRYMLTGGHSGHISLFDTSDFTLKTELNVNERINDLCVLHNETMYAVAQAQYTYIYDNSGIELHCLQNHSLVNQLQYLPYHFLLTSIGKNGWLKYQDISTGQFVTELRTRKGECKVMRQSKQNAVLHCGHHNGQVTLWSPNMSTPLVTLYCHRGDVNALEVTNDGYHMCTAGLDGQVKVWDLRTYKQLHAYFTTRPTTCMAVSDNNMLALGYSSSVAVWKEAFGAEKAQSPYLYQQYPGQPIKSLAFQPFEDVLSVGYTDGMANMIVPGAGEPNFDSLEANPYETKQQRREATVHILLDKLRPDMITIDNNLFGTMNTKSKVLFDGTRAALRDAEHQAKLDKEVKNRTRGRNSATKRFKRRHKNIVDVQTTKYKDDQVARQKRADKASADQQHDGADRTPSALSRFSR